MRWLKGKTEPADDGGIARLKQWAEINLAALYESHRQQRQRITDLDARVPYDAVSEQVTDRILDNVREWGRRTVALEALTHIHDTNLRDIRRCLQELEARVQALESMPPAWVRIPEEYKRHRQVEL